MKKIGSIQTPFSGAAKSMVESRGAGVATSNGFEMRGGEKGTPGKMEEVTTVSLNGNNPTGQVNVTSIANQR